MHAGKKKPKKEERNECSHVLRVETWRRLGLGHTKRRGHGERGGVEAGPGPGPSPPSRAQTRQNSGSPRSREWGEQSGSLQDEEGRRGVHGAWLRAAPQHPGCGRKSLCQVLQQHHVHQLNSLELKKKKKNMPRERTQMPKTPKAKHKSSKRLSTTNGQPSWRGDS